MYHKVCPLFIEGGGSNNLSKHFLKEGILFSGHWLIIIVNEYSFEDGLVSFIALHQQELSKAILTVDVNKSSDSISTVGGIFH